MSTVGIAHVQRLATLVEHAGGVLLDVPVSGSVALAEAGTLTLLVGGRRRHAERVAPVLHALGSTIVPPRRGRRGRRDEARGEHRRVRAQRGPVGRARPRGAERHPAPAGVRGARLERRRRAVRPLPAGCVRAARRDAGRVPAHPGPEGPRPDPEPRGRGRRRPPAGAAQRRRPPRRGRGGLRRGRRVRRRRAPGREDGQPTEGGT